MKEFDRKLVSEQAKERYDDACFAMLMDGYAAKLGEEYIAENERLKRDDSFCCPEGLDEKCLGAIERAFGEKRRRDRRAKLVGAAKKTVVAAASLILVLALGTAVLYNTVEAFRVRVVDCAIELFDIGEGAFISVKGNEEKVDGAEIVPTWLPEGYKLVEENDVGEVYVAKYSNGINTIRFTNKELSNSHNIDTENVGVILKIKVNERDAVVIIKDSEVLLHWYDYENGYAYSIWADALDKDTVVDIAESCYK